MYLAVSVPIALLALIGSFGITIPQSIRLYQTWKRTQQVTAFSLAIILTALSFYLVCLAYRIGMNMCLSYVSEWMRRLSSTQENGVWMGGIFGILTLIQCGFIPKLLQFFQKWKTTKNPFSLSLALLFGFLTFFFLAFIYFEVFLK